MDLLEAIEYIRNNEAHAAALAGIQEVREVLDRLRLSPNCWCVTRWKGSHDGRCQRARALLSKLEVGP
jgi:hypothetical protein